MEKAALPFRIEVKFAYIPLPPLLDPTFEWDIAGLLGFGGTKFQII